MYRQMKKIIYKDIEKYNQKKKILKEFYQAKARLTYENYNVKKNFD